MASKVIPTPVLFVGLGNPGDQYTRTRHNIGFMLADTIAQKKSFPSWRSKFQSDFVSQGTLTLLKPQTYMNLSGESVGAYVRFHKLSAEHVIVAHDDLDLKAGQVRVKQGGGSGGHNGLKSLDAHIGPDYWRIRLGIGRPPYKGDAVSNYVLAAFASDEQVWLQDWLDVLANSIDLVLKGDGALFQQRVQRLRDQKPDGIASSLP